MRREVPAEDLRKLYTANDMVKADCGGCKGCHECCTGMGESIVLDPCDIYRLTNGLKIRAAELFQNALELNVVDGVILPNLKMQGEEEACIFLNQKGRCTIHEIRPGICRMFPLGRYYENGKFSYFLQHGECPMQPKTKIKVSKWLGISECKKYEAYITRWHYFLEEIQKRTEKEQDEQFTKEINMYVLNTFFLTDYDSGDFYPQFEIRMEKMEKLLKVLK